MDVYLRPAVLRWSSVLAARIEKEDNKLNLAMPTNNNKDGYKKR